MTDRQHPSENQFQYSADSQSPRRPGWGLIHDVLPRQTHHSNAYIQPESRIQAATITVPRNTPIKNVQIPSKKQRFAQWFKKYALLVAAPLVIIASIRLSAAPIAGEGIIIAYGLLAVVRQVPSRISFWLATIALASIGLEFLLPGANRANNSALFVFLLLCVGLICSMLETRRMAQRDKALRRR